MFSFTKKETLPEEQSLMVELSEEELAQIVGGDNKWGWHHHYHHDHDHDHPHGHWAWKKVWEPVKVWKPVWEHVWEPGCY